MESDLGLGPSPAGDTADGNASELYVTLCSTASRLISPSPEHTLLPPCVSYRQGKPALSEDPAEMLSGIAVSAHPSTHPPALRLLKGWSPAAGLGVHTKGDAGQQGYTHSTQLHPCREGQRART